MMIAQQLYEGVEVKGRGTIGLVSYIRTDSVRISDEARAASKEYIISNMGEQYYGGNVYKNKKKDVQDAHEAIRPSYIELDPESIKDSLTANKNVYLRGFGSFIVKKRAEKVARNISKNTTITIPAHNIPAFKPAKSFAGKVKANTK